MKINFVDLQRQYCDIKEEIDIAIQKIIDSCAFIGNLNNPFVREFEENFAGFIGAEHCVACANGTDAIEILLKAFDIGPGDEVIVPAISWIATSEAVTNVGALPVFVDIESDYYCINPSLIEEKITSKTKAIIPVHLYGHPADMPVISEIAKKHNLILIEDCAQAHGATIGNTTTGTFGDAASFSFFPGKNLGAYGDAGGMVTNNKDIADTIRMISQHGQSGKKHQHLIEGRNSRMDGINAAILNVKLRYLDQWTKKRISISDEYKKLLSEAPVILPKTRESYRHVHHLFVIRTKNRDALMQYLNQEGISCAIQYPTALPYLDAYANRGFKPEDFPVAYSIPNEILSLPVFPELKHVEVEYICEKIISFYNS